MSKQKHLQKKLRQFRAEQKLKRKLAKAKQNFRPRKRERDSFVFVDVKGKRKALTSRALGYLFYVSKAGKRTLIRRKNEKIPKPKSQTEYDIAGQKKVKAVSKWERKLSLYQLGRVKSITSGTSITSQQIGQRLKVATDRFYTQHRGRPLLVIEIAATATIGRKTKIVRTQFQLSQAQVTQIKRGDIRFLQGLAWKQLSTELALDDLVSEGSAQYIKKLSINKGRKKKFKTKFGEDWGKEKYKRVQIKRVDFKFKTTSKL